jgi:hypothetical protein
VPAVTGPWKRESVADTPVPARVGGLEKGMWRGSRARLPPRLKAKLFQIFDIAILRNKPGS